MPYNETLSNRIREILATTGHKVEEKHMFGGICYMVNDKMCLGVVKDELMARIGPDAYEAALEKNGCRTMDMNGRPMKGFVFVDETGTANDAELRYSVKLALAYNPKAKVSKKKNPARGR